MRRCVRSMKRCRSVLALSTFSLSFLIVTLSDKQRAVLPRQDCSLLVLYKNVQVLFVLLISLGRRDFAYESEPCSWGRAPYPALATTADGAGYVCSGCSRRRIRLPASSNGPTILCWSIVRRYGHQADGLLCHLGRRRPDRRAYIWVASAHCSCAPIEAPA